MLGYALANDVKDCIAISYEWHQRNQLAKS